MRVGATAAVTDPGRKRRQNEDAYVCEPPLFGIADGVGGAQAGEIASRLAAGALRDGEQGSIGAEEYVAGLIREANRRVYDRSSEDEAVSGMGTTMTVALAGDEEVVIGHVGDSRAYRVREGRLEQLTDDHSLVAELVRSGKLSPEEAERHPQRSVITRALGSSPDVDVDTFAVPVQEGDFFMLCSDGLTDMIDDEAILAAVSKHRSDLRKAAKALVGAANRAGGEDNITVVCFDIEAALDDTQAIPVVEAPPAEDEVEVDDEEDTLSGLDAVPVIGDDQLTAAQLDEWLELDGGDHDQPPRRRRPWPRRHPIVLVLTGCAVLGAIFALAVWGLGTAHFVGVNADGQVSIYQGVPFDLTKKIHLYREVYVSPLYATQLTQAERRKLFAHDLRSYDSALAAISPYEQSATP